MLCLVVCCIETNISEELAALMMEAVSTSETSGQYLQYQTTWHNIPEDSHLEPRYMKFQWNLIKNVICLILHVFPLYIIKCDIKNNASVAASEEAHDTMDAGG
jgi:FPC/CPF motif-containing protein YcgG